MKRPQPSARDEWFDRLARGTAKRMSRRDAVGLFAGTTAIAILGKWIKPIHAFAEPPRAAPDPGCAGIRTFYSDGCAKPVPKLAPYKPAVNGCGPQNGFNPVPQAPLYLADFSPACDGHDRGYGTCNRPKEVTDKQFLEDMKSICAGPGTPLTGFVNWVLMLQCHRNAEIFYTAVSTIGDDPYKAGQSEGCDCCEECAGGGMKCATGCCPKGRVCGNKVPCCDPCQQGWVTAKDPNEPVCGFKCCIPGAIICPGMTAGSVRCCAPGFVCYKGGCNRPGVL